MKVRLQLLAILGLLVGGIICFSIFLKINITHKTKALLQDKLIETKYADVPKLLELHSAPIRTYTDDYSKWDQMVDFVEGRLGDKWATEEIVNALTRYQVNFALVLDSNYHTRYTAALPNSPVKEALVIAPDLLRQQLTKQDATSFFVQHSGAVVEVFTGSIRNTTDTLKGNGARGYFLVGRTVDSTYVAAVQSLSTEVTFSFVPPAGAHPDYTSSDGALLQFSVPFATPDGKRLGALNVQREYPELKRYYNYLFWFSLFFIASIVLLAGAFYYLVQKMFLQPMLLLSNSLRNGSTAPLEALHKKKNEFASLARLLQRFYQQNQLLKTEIDTRRVSEQNLSEALEEKRLADEEKQKVEEFLFQQQALLKLNNNSYSSNPQVLKNIVATCAQTLRCERVSIWYYNRADESISTPFIYVNSSNTYLPGKTIFEKEQPVYFSHLKNEVLIAAEEATQHPATIALAADHLLPNGITSVLDVTIRTGNQLRGVICFEDTGAARPWTVSEKVFVRSLSDIIAARMASEELRATEQQLMKSQKRFEETQELAQIGSWEIDFATQEIIWSREMYRIFEMEGVASENLREAHLQKVHPADRGNFDTAIRTMLLSGETASAEYRLLCNNGEVKYLLAYGEPLISTATAKATGMRGTVQDISKQKQAAMAKSDFLSCMSHEIRTPINGVIGIANLLADEQLTGRQAEYVKTLNFSAQHLSTIVSDILDFSKIEAGHLTFERVSFNLEENCAQLYNLFAQKAAEKNLRFHFLPQPGVAFSLYGDYVRLNQVLSNLLSNAIKFTETGSVDFSYTVTEENRHRIAVCFSVKDTGIGIPADQHATIFESFSQADDTISRRYGGTGLGLTISKKLMELQGGTIDVKSTPGKGSEFTVCLAFDKHVYEPQAVKQSTIIQKSIKKDLSGMRVLVAEDNHVNAMVLTSFLKKWSIQTAVAKDGAEALRMVHADRFDMVLMDIQMPNVNGIEATQQIRASADSGVSTVPVVAFTADASVDTHRELLLKGFDHCMTKPFSPDVLFSFLKKNYKPA